MIEIIFDEMLIEEDEIDYNESPNVVDDEPKLNDEQLTMKLMIENN